MQDRFYLRYVYNNKIYDIFAVDFFNKTAQLVSLDRAETLFAKVDTDKLIQCTGLCDKNGKLVYFDDLVKNKWGQICKVIMQTDKQNYGRVVLQNIKYLNDEAHKNNIFIPAAINESVIIGNIYENPELLEEK